MSEKALRILKVLSMNKNAPITVKMLAVMLDMSERTINTYLKEVSEYCDKQGFSLVSKRGVGVYLELSVDEQQQLDELLHQEPPHYQSTERQHYILQVLLDGWCNYTIAMFSEELYVSRQVIQTDLDIAAQWLQKYDLNLMRKSKTGIFLAGEEWKIRQAAAALNREKVTNVSVAEESCDYRIGKDTFSQLAGCYGKQTLDSVCRALAVFEQRLNNTLVDYCYVMLAEYLCVQRQRMEKGFHPVPDEHKQFADLVKPSPAFQLLIESLELAFSEGYSEVEQEYVYIILSGAEFQKNTQMLWVEKSHHLKKRVETISQNIINYLSDITGLDFESDERLLLGIESFLHKCIIRTRFCTAIYNPFLEEVKKNYSAIFNTCFGLGSYVQDVIGKLPSEHEIAYLTLLVGGALIRIEKRVNAVFIGTGKLLIAEMTIKKLEKMQEGLRIITILSADQKEELAALECDLIITTIKEYKTSRQMVYVTPIVDDRDVIRLRKACNNIFTGNLGSPDSVSLQDYIRPEFILLDVETTSKDKLIELGCSVLRKHGCVTAEYYQEILRRESISSTEIGNGVAIPHGIENTVLKPSICLIRLKNKVDWGNAPVDIIFMLALNFNDTRTTRQFFKLFYEKAGDQRTIELLQRANDSDEILQILQA